MFSQGTSATASSNLAMLAMESLIPLLVITLTQASFPFLDLQPQEATDVGNLGSRSLQGRVGNGIEGLRDLRAVEGVGV